MVTDRIDFNCDLGEGCGNDAAIVPHISSASLACGGHAGDEHSMAAAITLRLRHQVAIGAHPSFEDREHFGRRELPIAAGAVHALVQPQIARLAAACDAAGARMRHVKPHGALYNLAARDADIAAALADAVAAIDRRLWLYAASGSELERAGRQAGLEVAAEVFAERRYQADGQLLPRNQPGAVIEDADSALAQLRSILRRGRARSPAGSDVPLRAQTVCLHGDRSDAAQLAAALRNALEHDGIRVLAPGDRTMHSGPR